MDVTISSMDSPDDARAFRELNEEWITRFFTIEAADREFLGDPFGKIVAVGGDVLLARAGETVVGCVALVPSGNGVFELSKMAVSPAARNQGIGRMLVTAAIDRALDLGAASLFLGSNTKLANAVRLYEAAGFTHVPAERIGSLPYVRADVFMELVLR